MSNPIHRRSVDRFMAMADGREEVSVLASEYDALESENEALRSQLTDALNRQTCEGGQPYVCHALATARSRLADIEAQNRVMWDVANDREARLAAAEALLREAQNYAIDSSGGSTPYAKAAEGCWQRIDAFLAPASAPAAQEDT